MEKAAVYLSEIATVTKSTGWRNPSSFTPIKFLQMLQWFRLCEHFVYRIFVSELPYGPKEIISYINPLLSFKNYINISRWSHGMDTLMVDQHGDVYIVQSHTSHVRKVGRLPYDQWNSTQVVHLHTINLPDLDLPDNSPTSGDISPDGTQILLLSLHKVHYWVVPQGGNVMDTIKHHPIALLPITPHGATEGICWDTNGRNYYVVEEYSSSSPASVHVFNRV